VVARGTKRGLGYAETLGLTPPDLRSIHDGGKQGSGAARRLHS